MSSLTISCPANANPATTVALQFKMSGSFDTGGLGKSTFKIRCGGNHPVSGQFQQTFTVTQDAGNWSTPSMFNLTATPPGQFATVGAQLLKDDNPFGSPVGPFNITIAAGGTACTS